MNDLIELKKQHDSEIEKLKRRIDYCEAVANQYKTMFQQLEGKLKSLADRESNIQMVYDYLTRVGSEVAIKNPHLKRFLNPMSKALPPDDPKYLQLLKSFKFKAGDEVYYANERDNIVTYHLVNGVDIVDKHPRYIISQIFGYVDQSKLFSSESEAQWQLDEWNRQSREPNPNW